MSGAGVVKEVRPVVRLGHKTGDGSAGRAQINRSVLWQLSGPPGYPVSVVVARKVAVPRDPLEVDPDREGQIEKNLPDRLTSRVALRGRA